MLDLQEDYQDCLHIILFSCHQTSSLQMQIQMTEILFWWHLQNLLFLYYFHCQSPRLPPQRRRILLRHFHLNEIWNRLKYDKLIDQNMAANNYRLFSGILTSHFTSMQNCFFIGFLNCLSFAWFLRLNQFSLKPNMRFYYTINQSLDEFIY